MSQQPPLFTLPPIVEIDGVRRPTVNSAGRPIHPSPEGVRAFWEWFGDSQAVDAHGRPLVVYHGTGADFSVFRREGRKNTDRLHYFSNDPGVSSEYAGEVRYGAPHVMPAYLSLQNPFVFDAQASHWGSLPMDLFPQELVCHFDERNILRGKEGCTPKIGFTDVIRAAVTAGYDGVIAHNIIDGGGPYGDQHPSTVSVVHRPEQIKSALGNRGTFDPVAADITRSVSAWHGSPHRFDRFSLAHVGKGEGNQSYGWGLYFASQREVAEHYATKLTIEEKYVNTKLMDAYDPEHLLAMYLSQESGNVESAREELEFMASRGGSKAIRDTAQSALMLLDAGARPDVQHVRPNKTIYQVSIEPDEDTFLLFDRPLHEQSKKVRDALLSDDLILKTLQASADKTKDLRILMKLPPDSIENFTGKDIYCEMGKFVKSDKEASQYLAALGITGIKYLDGNSRVDGQGTFNYVIFDDRHVQIVANEADDDEDDPALPAPTC